MCDVGYLYANFGLLSVLELSRCTRQTDRRQIKASLNAPPIRGGGIINGDASFVNLEGK